MLLRVHLADTVCWGALLRSRSDQGPRIKKTASKNKAETPQCLRFIFFSARRLCCGPCAQEGANEHIGAASAVERQFQETAPAAELLPINYRSWQMDFVKKDT